jgi:nucleotide-binding universal stress UspA family protein
MYQPVMYQRILVPVQAASDWQDAVGLACQVSNATPGGTLILLTEARGKELSQFTAEASSVITRWAQPLPVLQGAQQPPVLPATDLPTVQVIQAQIDLATILSTASAYRADLIVLGSDMYRQRAKLFHPHAALSWITHLPVPVLLAPPPAVESIELTDADTRISLLGLPTSLIVVPLDGSGLGEQALVVATRFALRFRRPLLLLRVVPPADLLPGAGFDARQLEHDIQRTEEQEAHAYLATVRRCLSQPEQVRDYQEDQGEPDQPVLTEPLERVEAMVKNGDPASMIAQTAAMYRGSLLVMTTHGRRGLPRVLMGSVALQVAEHATVPVLLAPSFKTQNGQE